MKHPRKILATIVFVAFLLVSTIPVFAINYGKGTYGACQYGTCSITISSSGSIAVNVTPTSSGSCTIQSDSVSVFTDSSSGYSLTLANNSTNTSLVKGAATISSTAATLVSPAALTVNHWGYRVDGLGSFGAGPTSAQNNIAIGSTTFAGVQPSNGTPDVITSISAPADPAVVTNVWYGVCANTSVSSGTYTSQVTYTAVVN